MARKKKEWGIKYGCPIYGMAWPPGEYVFMCGGGGHGIENKCAVLTPLLLLLPCACGCTERQLRAQQQCMHVWVLLALIPEVAAMPALRAAAGCGPISS